MRAVPSGYPDSPLWFTTIEGRIIRFDEDLQIAAELHHPQPGWLGGISFHEPTDRLAIACRDRVVLQSADGTTLWEAEHAPYRDDGYLAAACLIDHQGRVWATSPGNDGDMVTVLDPETGRATASTRLGAPGYITRMRRLPIGAEILIAVYQGQDGRWCISASVADGRIHADRQDDDVPDDWSPTGDRAVWSSQDNLELTVAHSPLGPPIATRHIFEVSEQYGFANPIFVGCDLILADDEEKAYLFSSEDLTVIDSSSYGDEDIESLETIACRGERRWATYHYVTNTVAVWEWKDPSR